MVAAVAVLVCDGAAQDDSGYVLEAPECSAPFAFGTAATTAPFVVSSGARQAPVHRTVAKVCHLTGDGYAGLFFEYTAQDSYIYNPFTECDDHLYEYDAVEVFIAPGLGYPAQAPQHYVEIEVSPKGVLFESHITNPDDDCAGMTGDLMACNATAIEARARVTPDGWTAAVYVPYVTVAPGAHPPPSAWHLNMFRIDVVSPSAGEQFLAWSPTYKSPPCFHVPSAFGKVVLV
ncbi:uncharacterized protein AMSG_04379 [Thecamonas trahens ATCC 50062]|uniref:Carbohydrate-binding domain-containing protein n=1 Tax=Thecamonas trahens ATCC 50062 TaxID=461836 RepID=A0A0L0D7I4_THETB|nr:hypothetical protein AMSG_04379 [Thecamonas trahens ATCC 50062]KNC48150.1 hypothetical protein AMSG_04379 [Thecamonas trahens ATCC 50062]|eukprot:XP_013758720.1 hypothetical protein AMSG_04379 [Thecamonas trahens ATCC 50062]